MAHLACHPCMNIAFWMTYVQMGKYDQIYLAILFIVSISIELINRNLLAFSLYTHSDSGSGTISRLYRRKNIKYIAYFLVQMLLYPNFVLLFPIFILIDMSFGFQSIWLLIIWTVFWLYMLIRSFYRMLIRFYQA